MNSLNKLGDKLSKEWSFDDRAATYDNLSWVRDKELLGAMGELIFGQVRPKFRTILDLATGTGAVATYLSSRTDTVIGLDLSMPMLSNAIRASVPAPVTYIQGSAERLPICDKSIDLTVCRNGFHQMIDPHTAMAEIKRVTVENGELCVIESVAPSTQVKDQWTEIIMLKDRGRHPKFAFTAEELENWVHQCGFDLIRTSSHIVRFDVDEWIKMGGVVGRRARQVRELFMAAREETKSAMSISNESQKLYATKVSHMILARARSASRAVVTGDK